jgi:hypothetical protein
MQGDLAAVSGDEPKPGCGMQFTCDGRLPEELKGPLQGRLAGLRAGHARQTQQQVTKPMQSWATYRRCREVQLERTRARRYALGEYLLANRRLPVLQNDV